MFGGAGIYRDGVMFALVADETLYLKVDALTVAGFEAENLGPFVYGTGKGPNTIQSYRRAPERCLDDPQIMAEWAETALKAAFRQRDK